MEALRVIPDIRTIDTLFAGEDQALRLENGAFAGYVKTIFGRIVRLSPSLSQGMNSRGSFARTIFSAETKQVKWTLHRLRMSDGSSQMTLLSEPSKDAQIGEHDGLVLNSSGMTFLRDFDPGEGAHPVPGSRYWYRIQRFRRTDYADKDTESEAPFMRKKTLGLLKNFAIFMQRHDQNA
ncbi:MAG: hypothetical protein ACMG6E_04840 [Candidatus Roizmanbacteria bacterium]